MKYIMYPLAVGTNEMNLCNVVKNTNQKMSKTAATAGYGKSIFIQAALHAS